MVPFNDIVITRIDSALTVVSEKGRFSKMTNREFYGLSFCRSGQITYTQNGKDIVSDKAHAVILPKGQSYTLRGDESGVFPVINFDCSHPLTDTVLSVPVNNIEPVMHDFEQMKSLLLFERNRQKVMSVFYNILHYLENQNRFENDVLRGAVQYLETHFSSPDLTNKVLAQQCNISEIYFRKLFVKTFHTTPKQYILEARLNKARRLLTDGVLKISAVAEQCGFSNPYHFCRLFKERTGLTPSEFIKRNQINKI